MTTQMTPNVDDDGMANKQKNRAIIWFVQVLIAIGVLVVLCFMLLYIAMDTRKGSEFILQKIATEANISFQYGQGTLRSGITISNVVIGKDEPISIYVDSAAVKMGYRALLAKQVHLVDTQINQMTILNKNPPTDDPFEYKTLSLPVNLLLENTSIGRIRYEQVNKDPMILSDIVAKKMSWYHSVVTIEEGAIGVNADSKQGVVVGQINGKIDLSGDYPLDMKATVMVDALKSAHFEPLLIEATGTLKRTTGNISTLYNKAKVHGQFIIQGVDDHSPFWADVNFEQLTLPYVDEQQIMLSDGKISAMGVLSAIDLRVNSQLSAKDIPNGHYKMRAVVNSAGMVIDRLTVNNKDGDLLAKGKISWQDKFWIDATVESNNYAMRTLMPNEYAKYQNYLPKTLQGQMSARVDLDEHGLAVYKMTLDQRDGEYVHAVLTQPADNAKNKAYELLVNWQNYVRTDLPDIGELSSSRGQLAMTILDEYATIVANAQIEKLLGLPVGQYEADANLNDDDITIRTAKYVGQMGQIHANGMVYLANDHRPLSWEIHGDVDNVKPNVYFNDPNKTPISVLTGTFFATGRQRRHDKMDEHDIQIHSIDMNVGLKDGQNITIFGQGQAMAHLLSGDVNYLASSFKGKIQTAGIHQALSDGDVILDVSGDLDNLTVHQLDVMTKAGHVQAQGELFLKQAFGWNLTASMQDFQPSLLSDQFKPNVFLTADVISWGNVQNGIINANVNMDGNVRHGNDANDRLTADVVVASNKYTINRLNYMGKAGQLSATGWVDTTQGIVADVSALVENFDLGFFIKDRPSQLTGDIKASIDWQDDAQIVNVNHLDIQGMMNDETVFAKGSLYAHLDLPNNLNDFMMQLRHQGRKNFDLDHILQQGLTGDAIDHLTNLQAGFGELESHVQKQNDQLRRVIKELAIGDMQMRFGDNYLKANGNQDKLVIHMDVQKLSQIFPTIRGEITGGLIVASDEQSLPTIYSDLSISNISMPKFAIAKLNILGKIVNFGNAPSSLLLTASNVFVANQRFKDIRLDLKGTQGNHDIRLFANNGEMKVNVRTQGGFNGKYYQAVISEGRLQTHFGVLNQEQPAELKYVVNNQHIKIAPHCWQTISANKKTQSERGMLCLTDALSIGHGFGDIALTINNIDTAVLTPLLPNDLLWRSKLFGEAKFKWARNQTPDIQAILYSENGTIGMHSDDQTEVDMPYEHISLVAKSEPKGLRLRTDMSIGQSGGGYADVVIDPYTEQKPITGSLVMKELNLAILRPFFPAIQTLRGKINMNGGVSGTLQRPLFFGNASITHGAIALAEAPIALDDLVLDASIQGTQADIQGEFTSGMGKGVLTGSMDWHAVPTAKFIIKGDDLVVSSPPLLSATISPHLEILTRPTQKFVDIKGVISVPSAVIRPPESTGNVIAQSPDVVVIDRRMTGNIADILQQVSPWTINADIGVDLGDNVLFRGFGTRLPLSGAIRLSQFGQGSLQGRGMVFVNQRTSVDFVGQNLELNYAQIRFDGDSLTKPNLSIEAVREIDGQTVGVRVTGTASNPIITTFNDAGLSEQQAMNALITGSLRESGAQVSEQDFRTQVNNTLAVAGLSLGLQSTKDITNQLGQALGLQSLTLGASGGASDTNVNVTGYISPDLYVRYGVGVFNAQSTLSMRYQLTRRVYVEATSGIEKAVDVIYRWRW